MTTEPVTAETPQGAGDAAELPRRLEEARRRFDEWRKTRPRIGPIPEELWTEAREKTFHMLLGHDAITPERIELLRGWRHSGFQVHAERRLQQGEHHELEPLLEYVERPPVDALEETVATKETKPAQTAG